MSARNPKRIRKQDKRNKLIVRKMNRGDYRAIFVGVADGGALIHRIEFSRGGK